MNLKEIAVKCETVEQKKLVSDIMSEELKCGFKLKDDNAFEYVVFSYCDTTVKDYKAVEGYKIVFYSDFIQRYPKYIIQSGDIVEYDYKLLLRIIEFRGKLSIIGDNDWSNLNDYESDLKDSRITKIIRPTCNMDLSSYEGTTIWQRKSKNDIKREAIQLEIDKLTEELNKLGGN